MTENNDTGGKVTIHPFARIVIMIALTVTLAVFVGWFVVDSHSNEECGTIESVHVQSDGDILITFTEELDRTLEVTYTTQGGVRDVETKEVGWAVSTEVNANADQNTAVWVRLYDGGEWVECGEYNDE